MNQRQIRKWLAISAGGAALVVALVAAGLILWLNSDPGRRWIERMAGDGHLMGPYVSFKDWHDPRSGLVGWVAGPRFSQGYTALQNRPGLLIETHMLKPYPVRVETAGALIRHTMAWMNERGAELRRLNLAADARSASPAFRDEPFALAFARTDSATPFEFAGIPYEEVSSEITGGTWYRYGGDPVTVELDFYDRQVPSVTAALPEAAVVRPPRPSDHYLELEVGDRGVLHIGVRTGRHHQVEHRPYGTDQNPKGQSHLGATPGMEYRYGILLRVRVCQRGDYDRDQWRQYRRLV